LSIWTNTKLEILESLKVVFVDKSGDVTQAVASKLFQWYKPITTIESKGYTISKIATLIGYSWFHGWMTYEDAESSVSKAQEGTFLFRFSTGKPGVYALTVAHNGQPNNWRVHTEKDGRLELNNSYYSSLNDVFVKHKSNPLKIVREDKTTEDVILKDGIPRQADVVGSDYANLPKKQ